MKKKTLKGRAAARTGQDAGMRKLLLNIHHNDLCDFHTLCQQDGMALPDGVRFLIRWAISQKSLCPIMPASAVTAAALDDLHDQFTGLHRKLTNTLQRMRITAAHVEEDEDNKGEEWKKGGAL